MFITVHCEYWYWCLAVWTFVRLCLPFVNVSWDYYRQQTKFAKVMFSQVSVCPWGGGVCVAWECVWLGGMHGRGGGMCGRGCVWQGECMVGVCMVRGVCGRGMHGRGYVAGRCAWQRGICGRGHAWQGACMAGGVHGRGACMPPPQQILRDMHPTGMHSCLR